MRKPNVLEILPIVEKEIREILKSQGFKMTYVDMSSSKKKVKIEINIVSSEDKDGN